MTTETELNLFFTMLAHNKRLKREGIELIHNRCRADVDQVLRGIDDVSPKIAPAVEPTPALLLSPLGGIDVLKYIGIKKI